MKEIFICMLKTYQTTIFANEDADIIENLYGKLYTHMNYYSYFTISCSNHTSIIYIS